MSFVPASRQPDGTGDLTFHMEDGLLSLNNVHYFNRGTELRAVADIDEVWNIPDSPLVGTAAGTIRPFRDLRLPFLSGNDIDTVVTALQGNLTTVGLAGTVRDYQLRPVAFEEVGQGLRMLLVGDVEKERRRAR